MELSGSRETGHNFIDVSYLLRYIYIYIITIIIIHYIYIELFSDPKMLTVKGGPNSPPPYIVLPLYIEQVE